jgi:hypothetical protein
MTRWRQRGPGVTRCGARLPEAERPRAVGEGCGGGELGRGWAQSGAG